MNIDERLEALTERHEALTQTVELIAAMQRVNETRWQRDFGELRAAIQQDAENIRALARIAELHHERLGRLEDRP
jgi:archaellum component FlaC